MSGDGKLTPLIIIPGINKDTTEYAAEGYWIDADKVRFRDGRAEKIGGWVHEQAYQVSNTSATNFHGVARDIITWTDLDSVRYVAVGTNEKLEVLTGGLYYDITPIAAVASVSNAMNTSIGSTLVIVSAVGHPGVAGDYVILTPSATVSIGVNIYLEGQYVITTTPNANSFGVSALLAATSTSTATGGGLHIDFLLHTGLQSNAAAFGWGAGTWGRGGWGSAASTGVVVNLAQWSLDTFGEDLLACRQGGYLYKWNVSAGPLVRAAIVTAAPTINNIVVVHNPTRHVISFGCTDLMGVFDPMLVRWSDQDNINDWTPTVSNASGEYPIQGGNRIVAVQQTTRETLILSDSTLNIMRYTGDENVFSFEKVGGTGHGAISMHCVVDANGTPIWMALGAFFKYDGGVKALETTIDKYLFRTDSVGSVNLDQKEKVFAGTNTSFSEAIWLYPSRDSDEIDRYVITNYDDNTWYTGTIQRTVWEDSGVFPQPYAANVSGILYVHEESFDDDGNIMPARLESGWFDIDQGDDLMFIDKVVPDIRRLNGKTITLTLQFKKYPESTEVITKGPYTITEQTGKISLRARGRQGKVILEQNETDASFELGNIRGTILPDGKR